MNKNNFYNGQQNLKAAGVKIEFTGEQITEYMLSHSNYSRIRNV